MRPKLFLSLFSLPLLLLPQYLWAIEPDYQAILNQAQQKYAANTSGKVASYIPALAKYDHNLYGIALVTVDGKIYTSGNSSTLFPLESLSKIFTLALALQQFGPQVILDKIGANATGLPFNSILAIEQQPTRTGNPLVNAGAIATVSLIKAATATQKWKLIHDNLNNFANTKLAINQEVYTSEFNNQQHNLAIAELLDYYNHLYSDVQETVNIYTKQCSINVTALDLAKMGAVLANNGKSPFTQQQLINKQFIPNLLAEMTIAGLYNNSGHWLYLVGLPAKSGVSGGILAIAPHKFAIAVYSPPLDSEGNSVRGQQAIQYIVEQLRANIFQ